MAHKFQNEYQNLSFKHKSGSLIYVPPKPHIVLLNFPIFLLNLTCYFNAFLYLCFLISSVKFCSKLIIDASFLPLKPVMKLLLTF